MKAQVSIRIRTPRGVKPPFAVLEDAAARGNSASVKVRWRAWEDGKVSAARLARFGLVKEFDRADRLLLDHDSTRAPNLARYHRKLAAVGLRPVAVAYERSPHGWHVIVQLDREYSLAARVALQMSLGSDWCRENYNLMRALQLEGSDGFWRRRSNVFYRESIWRKSEAS